MGNPTAYVKVFCPSLPLVKRLRQGNRASSIKTLIQLNISLLARYTHSLQLIDKY